MPRTALLISDLHLSTTDDAAAQQLAELLLQARTEASQVMILGDLFEAWIGDDVPGPIGDWVAQQLAALSRNGVDVFFMHGNRDFLLGEQYARRCGMRIVHGPVVASLTQGPTLLLHGDELCTDDHAYQQLRRQVRDPAWQQQFLSQPLEQRLQQAQEARAASRKHTRQSTAQIMDVNPEAVERFYQHFSVQHMIHGHTHRPALHRYPHANGERTRLVLGDWATQAAPHWLAEPLQFTS